MSRPWRHRPGPGGPLDELDQIAGPAGHGAATGRDEEGAESMEQTEPGADRGATIRQWARSPARAALVEASLIAALALTLNLAGNGRFGLFDRDEPRYAGCMRAMRQSGDYLHPTFNGVPRYQKPVLIYWLMLAGTAVGGDNPFGLRLVSALSGAATCVLTWAWGRRMLGPGAGRLAACMLATAPIMVVESKMATTDAFLTLLLTSCQFALWTLNRGPSQVAAAVFWMALGLSMLTKGPVGVALICRGGPRVVGDPGPFGLLESFALEMGPGGIRHPDAPLVPRNRDHDAGRVLPGGGRAAGRDAGRPSARGARGLPRLLPDRHAPDILPVVDPPAGGSPGGVGLPEEYAGPGGPAGLGDRPFDPSGVRRTKLVHYYLPAYPACAPAGGLASRDAWPGRDRPEALSARAGRPGDIRGAGGRPDGRAGACQLDRPPLVDRLALSGRGGGRRGGHVAGLRALP